MLLETGATCVHMTALNCLVRNANTYAINGNSLSLDAWGGYAIRRSPFGGELYRLTQEQAQTILRAPFAKSEASTALSTPEPAPTPQPTAPTVQEPSPEAKTALDDVARQFTVNKKGQGEFGF